ncbi:hypothetical protein [Moraxella oculi]|uniref:Uncharacterized protein n=1 Tax=Moraxella oculi TaxID=2940516 RepID=A0ABW8U5W1_9GAMM
MLSKSTLSAGQGTNVLLVGVVGLDKRLICLPNLSHSVHFGQGSRPVGF